jgi:hypothetical protein
MQGAWWRILSNLCRGEVDLGSIAETDGVM